VACAANAANANDTLAFERLFLAAFAVMARIRTVFADKGYQPVDELAFQPNWSGSMLRAMAAV
jgi:hypothetical protein